MVLPRCRENSLATVRANSLSFCRKIKGEAYNVAGRWKQLLNTALAVANRFPEIPYTTRPAIGGQSTTCECVLTFTASSLRLLGLAKRF